MHIWLDRYDGEIVILGDYAQASLGRKARYNAWSSGHIDGISEMFGQDAYEAVRDSQGEPIELTVAVLKVAGDDVCGCKRAMDTAERTMHDAADCSAVEKAMDELVTWLEGIGV